jgi:hypothetical protein
VPQPDPVTGRGTSGFEKLMALTGGNVGVGISKEPFSLPTGQIRFSHDEINPSFEVKGDPGATIWKLANQLREDPNYYKEKLEPLRVVQIGPNDFISLDNRRLGALILSESPNTMVRWATTEEINNELLWRFTSNSEGLWARVRGTDRDIVVPR